MSQIQSMSISNLPDLITRTEVARVLRISEHTLTVRRKELEVVLPVIKLNSRVFRYRRSDLERLIQQGWV